MCLLCSIKQSSDQLYIGTAHRLQGVATECHEHPNYEAVECWCEDRRSCQLVCCIKEAQIFEIKNIGRLTQTADHDDHD